MGEKNLNTTHKLLAFPKISPLPDTRWVINGREKMSGGVTLRSKHAPQRLRTELPLLNMKDPQKTV